MAWLHRAPRRGIDTSKAAPCTTSPSAPGSSNSSTAGSRACRVRSCRKPRNNPRRKISVSLRAPFQIRKCDSLPANKKEGGDMTRDEFAKLLSEFTLSAETGDGARFATHFTDDATYHDYIYGPHTGRAGIA